MNRRAWDLCILMIKSLIAANRILVIFLTLTVSASLCAQQIDGPTVLKKMLDAEGKVTFTAHQVTTLAKGPALTSEQIIYRSGFRGMRTEYLEPSFMKGEIRADDGRQQSHLIPKAKVLRVGPSRLAELSKRTDQASRGSHKGEIKVDLVGRDKIAGRNAYVIQVRPSHNGGAPTRKFWVDTETWIKLKTEDISSDGKVLSMSYYTRIDFPRSIPDSKFRIDPPTGYRVEKNSMDIDLVSVAEARKTARFKLLEPSYLPSGFKAVGACVIPFRRNQVVAIRYTDGVTSFSLFQTREKVLDRRFIQRLHEGPVETDKGVYTWRQSDLSLTIVGQLQPEQMRKIADSVK